MTYIKENWIDKDRRAKQAIKHTEEMWLKYSSQIKESIRNTITYDDFSMDEAYYKDVEIILEPLDSVSAIIKYRQDSYDKMAVLNFASYRNPGGMFLQGSKAQEECLCHESTLYNVLSQFEDTYYAWNNKHKNKGLYTNRALYTPDIIFHRDNCNVICDVITCAAPNFYAASKYLHVTDTENRLFLKSRIKYVLDVAKTNNVSILILGAYGCGVFGQNPKIVANIFLDELRTHKCFDKVVFAIPDENGDNYKAFYEVFSN